MFKTNELSRVMHLDGCHLCKSPYPRDAMTVDAKTDSIRHQFYGGLCITVRAAYVVTKDVQNDEEDIRYTDISSAILFRIPPIVVCVLFTLVSQRKIISHFKYLIVSLTSFYLLL